MGEIYEVASVYMVNGYTHIGLRDTFVYKEIEETHMVLECISQEEVLKRCCNQENVAVNAVGAHPCP